MFVQNVRMLDLMSSNPTPEGKETRRNEWEIIICPFCKSNNVTHHPSIPLRWLCEDCKEDFDDAEVVNVVRKN